MKISFYLDNQISKSRSNLNATIEDTNIFFIKSVVFLFLKILNYVDKKTKL